MNHGSWEEHISNYNALSEVYVQADKDISRFCKLLNATVRNHDLASRALAATPLKNEASNLVQQFGELIEKDFREFCDVEPHLNDVVPILALLELKEKLQQIANFPKLHSKRIGALGGGFSSGKSAFLNSFLKGHNVRLAEGIRPVTAIPSFVINDNECTIQGLSQNGGVFEIPVEIYKTISHKMMESMKFNLRDLIQYIIVQAPLPHEMFSNICLMDTPGYNPSGVSTRKHDEKIAQEYLKKAEFLIWMIGLDSNGTISKDDLEFLDSLDFGKENGKPLYIVANKADLKPVNEIEDILDDIMENVENAGFIVSGFCAYSSKRKPGIISSRNKNIYEFLTENNQITEQYENFHSSLQNVFKNYVEFIETDSEEKKGINKELNRLLLDALSSGGIDIRGEEAAGSLEEGLKKLLRKFDLGEYNSKEKRMERLSILRGKFLNCLNNFCNSAGIKVTRAYVCTSCGELLDLKEQYCPKCGKYYGLESVSFIDVLKKWFNQ